MKKRIVSLIMVLLLCFSFVPISTNALSNYDEAMKKATALDSLGLFEGTDNGYELDKNLTRAEMTVLFLRLTGEESVALSERKPHPFTDVPSWANNYIGYAYQKGYVNGISAYEFGSNTKATSEMFYTLILRWLGYTDGENGDFIWSFPHELAFDAGITTGSVGWQFTRADAVIVCWETLFALDKNGEWTVNQVHRDSGLYSFEQFDNALNVAGFANTTGGVVPGTYICYTDSSGQTYAEEYRPSITLYADHKFLGVANFGEGMAEFRGTWDTFVMDDGSLMVGLDRTSGYEHAMFSLYIAPSAVIITDGYMGITAVESVFMYEKDGEPTAPVVLPPVDENYDEPVSTKAVFGYYTCESNVYGEAYTGDAIPWVALNHDGTAILGLNYGEGMARGHGTWEMYQDGDAFIDLTITTSPWYDVKTTYTFDYTPEGLIAMDSVGIVPSNSFFWLIYSD